MNKLSQVIASFVVGSALAVSAASKPNIIVIVTDDQGFGDISAHGNPILKTPNLDRLHDEGVRFKQFQVSPTCAPMRSALMTGRHEFRNGITHTIFERERMTLKAVTLPEVLRSAGYTTGIFGKWHLGDEDAYQPEKRGFDEVFIHGAGGIGQSYAGTCGDAPGNSYFNPAIKHDGTFEKTTGYCTDVFFGQAARWIAEAKGGKPFFAYITPNAPHGPLDCPPEYEKMYAGKVKPNEAKFFGMIANIDDNVGRLLAKLDELKIATNTLVIFMNDNGGTAGTGVFNAGLHGSKGSAWQGGVRASSFWRWPGTFVPQEVPQLAAHLDVFPTLAELIGVKLEGEVARQVEGVSLLPLLRGAKVQWAERTLVTHVGRWKPGTPPEKFSPQNCSIRNQRFSMVRVKEGWHLFDLEKDPGELKNVSTDHAEVVKELSAAYDKWWDEVTPMLVNEEAYKTAQAVNPFKEQYWKQFGGGPAAGEAQPRKRNVR